MTVKSLLEVRNTNYSGWELLNIILSDFQQYRTLLAKVIQLFVPPENVKIKGTSFSTPDRHYTPFHLVRNLFLPGAKLQSSLKLSTTLV